MRSVTALRGRRKYVVVEEALSRRCHVRVILRPKRKRMRYRVDLWTPESGWVAYYNCGSIRKALEFVDGPLTEECKKYG